MLVFIKGPRGNNEFHVNENMTIGSFRRLLTQMHYSDYFCRIELVFQGRTLRHLPTLEEYGISNGVEISIDLRFKNPNRQPSG
jgi:hypothetical protein